MKISDKFHEGKLTRILTFLVTFARTVFKKIFFFKFQSSEANLVYSLFFQSTSIRFNTQQKTTSTLKYSRNNTTGPILTGI